ncbi:phage tail tip lysozyme [Terrabacter carboxydivorans]|uniref:Peptidoglycan hydrolase-like protein with peptidoglycan-binding domain n=1 Tax=Terrabacter carboxydivorans TaxID=619730 RepID=A0ABP5Y0C6_9MICO
MRWLVTAVRGTGTARRVLSGLLAGIAVAVLAVVAAPSALAASNDEIAFDYFVAKGLTERQSAGIVGNLIQESGSPINPYADQPGGPGMGIAQWSEGGRWDTDSRDNLVWHAGLDGSSRYSLTAQLDFTWYELSTFSGYGLADLRAATTVDSATTVFMQDFERCGTCATTQRIAYANDVLTRYGTGGTGGSTTETSLPVLRSGSSGTAVRTLQYLLRASGRSVVADGSFGAATDSAVRSYQSAHGLTVDGVVGDNTWYSLLPVLRQGASGDAVTGLQRELVDAGYSLTVDGSFGPATDSAVRAYQSKTGLVVDGVVGNNTWGSLVD